LIDVKVNGNTQARVGFDADAASNSGEDSDSTSFVVRLNVGDRVWVSSAGNDVYTLWGLMHTFFSGALLYSL
jgi:hypothetical protein